MESVSTLTLSDIPEDGLRLFHGISNWVEQAKTTKPKLIGWRKGQKCLTTLNCIKPKQNESLKVPENLPENTLYVPINFSGLAVIRHLRNAFCHNGLTYNKIKGDYMIKHTGQKSISGRFSIDAINEFLDVYLQPYQQNIKLKKTK